MTTGLRSPIVVEQVVLAPVRWADIEQEVKPFRDGLVDAFLRYRDTPVVDDVGRPLRDGSNRPVKVTQANFCTRFGIPTSTFADWLKHRGDASGIRTDLRVAGVPASWIDDEEAADLFRRAPSLNIFYIRAHVEEYVNTFTLLQTKASPYFRLRKRSEGETWEDYKRDAVAEWRDTASDDELKAYVSDMFRLGEHAFLDGLAIDEWGDEDALRSRVMLMATFAALVESAA